VVVDYAREKELKGLISQFEAETRMDLGGFDPEVQSLLRIPISSRKVCDSKRRDYDCLAPVAIPHGVLA